MRRIPVAPGKIYLSGSFQNKISDVVVGRSGGMSIYAHHDSRLVANVGVP